MKYSVQLNAGDLTALHRLGLRPRKWLKIVGYLVILLLAVTLLCWIQEWITTGYHPRSLVPMLAVVAYLALLYWVLLPWRSLRTFRQQKTLQRPFTVEFTEEMFVCEAPHGSSRIPWADFHKWKANRHIIALYHSDAACNPIPTRVFPTEGERQAVLSLIERRLGPQKA